MIIVDNLPSLELDVGFPGTYKHRPVLVIDGPILIAVLIGSTIP